MYARVTSLYAYVSGEREVVWEWVLLIFDDTVALRFHWRWKRVVLDVRDVLAIYVYLDLIVLIIIRLLVYGRCALIFAYGRCALIFKISLVNWKF